MTDFPPKNIATVSSAVLRGARPDADGALWLVGQGVRTVLNLEWEQGDDVPFAAFPAVKLLRVRDFEPLPWFAPSLEDQHVVQALAELRLSSAKCFVHCRSGQNRTGVVIAAYRLLELRDPLPIVLVEFASYRGLWAWGDEAYIRSIGRRRADLVERVNNLVRVV